MEGLKVKTFVIETELKRCNYENVILRVNQDNTMIVYDGNKHTVFNMDKVIMYSFELEEDNN